MKKNLFLFIALFCLQNIPASGAGLTNLTECEKKFSDSSTIQKIDKGLSTRKDLAEAFQKNLRSSKSLGASSSAADSSSQKGAMCQAAMTAYGGYVENGSSLYGPIANALKALVALGYDKSDKCVEQLKNNYSIGKACDQMQLDLGSNCRMPLTTGCPSF